MGSQGERVERTTRRETVLPGTPVVAIATVMELL